MKNTTPKGQEFRPQFSAGAVARSADSNDAAHGADMDAPEILPAGGWENASVCHAYPWPRMSLISR